MQDIILFDIDGTLFNTEKFGKLIRARFIDIIGIEEEDLIRANADYYAELPDSTDFNAHDITTFIAGRFGIDTSLLDEVFWGNDKIYKDSLYDEADEVLSKLSQDKALGAYSQGFEKLQNRKLEASGIANYFDNKYKFFHRRKTTDEAIALLPKNSIVIDDNHDVVQKIAPFVTPVWINRRTEDRDSDIKTIHNLTELL